MQEIQKLTLGTAVLAGGKSSRMGQNKVLMEYQNRRFLDRICEELRGFDEKPCISAAMPGEYGNFSLAGHSSYRYNEVFNELHKINLDDEIIIKTLNNEFTYVVKDIFEVNPEDTFVLDQDNEIKELTIVTCTNKGKDRLIVKAEIVEDKNNK